MKKPFLQDDAFLADVRAAGRDQNTLHVWWLGQSGFLLQSGGRHVLLDPYLSESLTNKYRGTDRPHTRLTERVIAPERLDFLDAVSSSHNHTDHLDAETLRPLMAANPRLAFVIPEANRAHVAKSLPCAPDVPRGLDAGQSLDLGGITFHGVPAAHPEIDRDESGRHRFMGYVVEIGPWRVYHSGDTYRYDGMEDVLKPFAVDAALLPINGRHPDPGIVGNLDGAESARLAKAIGAKTAIPCHYDLFEFNTASPTPFADECRKIKQPYRTLKTGERWSI